MNRHFVFSLANICLLFISSCGISITGSETKPQNKKTPPKTQSVKKCETRDDRRIVGKLQTQSIHLERHFQKIHRLNCEGNTVSNKVETVKSPTAWAKIYWDSPEGFKDGSTCTFRNRTACTKGGIQFYSSDKVRFHVDYSFGALNMHVVSGDNYIDYACRNCQKEDQNQCQEWGPVTNGTFILTISYSEKQLPPTTYIPSPSECSQ